jgi:Fe2+ or Zn2+ uptake regulation protein
MEARTKPETSDAAAALRRSGYRVTPQRLAVAKALSEAGRHLSAEELMDALGDALPGVSLPTVYASLEALENAGLVRRVAGGRGPGLYDAGPAAHHHMVCRRCGGVTDLEADVALAPALDRARRQGFDAEGAEVVVRGLCADCHAAAT